MVVKPSLRTSHAKSNNVAMAKKTFLLQEKKGSINGSRIDENFNALIVIPSVSNAQETDNVI